MALMVSGYGLEQRGHLVAFGGLGRGFQGLG